MKYNKVNVVKKITFLLMTMALAVAMVACTGAVKQGPPGEKGDKGDPGTTAGPEPGDTTPGEPRPVQMIKSIDPVIINNDDKGKIDLTARTVMAADHFYPSGLMYKLGALSQAQGKRIEAGIDPTTGVVTVMLKDGNEYQNDTLKVTAEAPDGSSSEPIDFNVRRNRAPEMVKSTKVTAGTEYTLTPTPVDIWVGTQDEKIVKTGDKGIRVAANPGREVGKKVPTTGNDAVAADGMHALVEFFKDDDGNELSFEPDVSTSDSKKLTVIGGNKVTLLGIKTTWNKDLVTPAHEPIDIYLVAMDKGGLESDEALVLKVRVDEAPKISDSVEILPTQVLMLGEASSEVSIGATAVAIADMLIQFTDDADRSAPADALEIYAWSDTPDIVKVVGNRADKKDVKAYSSGGAGDEFNIIGVSEGAGIIKIKAMEPKDADMSRSANLMQSVELSLKVVVKK